MADATKIEWADSTFNPWIGCTKISTAEHGGGGCDHCYAERDTPVRVLRGKGIETWGSGAPRQRTGADYWKQPLRWNAQANEFEAAHGHRRRVFCASLADVFDNEVDPAWRADLFALIAATPRLDWLLLTKRVGNANQMIGEALIMLGTRPGGGGPTSLLPSWPWPNVWLGATVVNQAEADRDVPKLLATPAAVHFLSIEPMLGPVDVSRYMWPVCGWWRGPHRSYSEAKAAGAECGLKRQGLVLAACKFVDWVIAGGESGAGARPMHPDWARSLRDQCAASGVPFMFKQWGAWAPAASFPYEMRRWGKNLTGRKLEGREHDGFPEVRS